MAVVHEMATAIIDTNVFLKHTSAGASLSTSNRRASFIKNKFPVVEPLEFVIDKQGHNAVYVSLLQMLQALLSRDDVLEKAMSLPTSATNKYCSFRDGVCFQEKKVLTEDKFTIAIGLYIDYFEVANPLGTSKKKHKLCAVYWTLANLDSKYRSTLHAIQLAVLCKVSAVREHGYHKILEPLVQDLMTLEENGVHIEKLGASIKGTLLDLAADNLAAHSVAGFQECFTAGKICRFCMANHQEIQAEDATSKLYTLRTKLLH